MAAEPAVVRSRAFLRAGRTAGRHRSRRERRGARHAVAALWPRDVCSSKRARRARASSCAPRSTTITSTPTTSSASTWSCSACARRARSASRRRRPSARLSIDPASPRFVAGALLESEAGARARRSAAGASRSHADARHEPAGRLRELESRRRRWSPDQRLRRDRLRDAALGPVRARRRRRARLLLYTAADAHDRHRRQHACWSLRSSVASAARC